MGEIVNVSAQIDIMRKSINHVYYTLNTIEIEKEKEEKKDEGWSR